MAGPWYVRSTDGDDGSDGLSWANAKATLAGAFTAASAGDTIYVSDNHAESQASAMTLTSPGTAAAPCRVLCVDDSAEPPTALATTATIATANSGGYAMQFAGFAYYYGITFNVSGGIYAGNISFGTNATPWWMRFERCALKSNGSAAPARVFVGIASSSGSDDQMLELHNTSIGFAAAGQGIEPHCPILWTGTASAITGTAPTSLFLPIAGGIIGPVDVCGVDLSPLGSGNLASVGVAQFCRFRFVNCKLGSGAVLKTGTIPGQGGSVVEMVNCDSADTNHRYQKSCYQGDIYSESTIVRTGGASDGTTTISRKMVSSANAKFFSPLELGPLAVWNESTGSALTATVEVVTDNVTLTDAECWLEVEYLGTSGYPLSSVASDRSADIMATPANQTTSSETWTTTGLSTPVTQKLSVAFTPQEKGLIRCRVMLAKASTTVYVDPKITISDSQGTTQQYQCGSEYVNGPYEPTGSSIAAAVWAYAKRTLTR